MAKWIPTGEILNTTVGDFPIAECSECHEPSAEIGKFCPHCGEKMEDINSEEYKAWGYKG